MPKVLTLDYVFGGAATQEFYSESEMAEAVGLSAEELRAALDEELYGPCVYPQRKVYSFHLHPAANGGRKNGIFLFRRETYQHNLARYHLVNWMRKQGLWKAAYPEACRAWVLKYDLERMQALSDEDVPGFIAKFNLFLQAWVDGDGTYDEAIKGWYKYLDVQREIWFASGYLLGLEGLGITRKAITFHEADEPQEGITIPWEYLRIHPSIGFYDQRDHPDLRQQFIRTPKPEEWTRVDKPLIALSGFDVLNKAGKSEIFRLSKGDLIAGQRWVYDEWVEFVGMVLRWNRNEITFTDNGKYTMDTEWDTVEAVYR